MKSKLETLRQTNKQVVDTKIEQEDSSRKLERSRSPRAHVENVPSSDRMEIKKRLDIEEENTWDAFSFGTQLDPTERERGFDSVTSYESREVSTQRRRDMLRKKEDMELRMNDLSRKYRSEANLAAVNSNKERPGGYNSTAEFTKIEEESLGCLQEMEGFEGSFQKRAQDKVKSMTRCRSEHEESKRSLNFSHNEVVFEEEVEDSDFENSKNEENELTPTDRTIEDGILTSSRMNSRYQSSNLYNVPSLQYSDAEVPSPEKDDFKKKRPRATQNKFNSIAGNGRSRSKSRRNKKASYQSVQNLNNLLSENRSKRSFNMSDKENSVRLLNRNQVNQPYQRELLLLSKKLEETDKQAMKSFSKLSQKYEKLINEYIPYTEDEDLELGDRLSEEIGDIASKGIKKKRSKWFCNLFKSLRI